MKGISQSSLIAFYLLAAFVVFITIRSELSIYVGFFTGSAAPTPGTSAASSSQLSSAQSLLLQGAQLALIA